MERKLNLIDINFRSLSVSEKRVAFVLMDVMMKRLHANNYMVSDLSPSNIYYEDGYYYFDKVTPITAYNSENREQAILKNSLELANLAFCSYLPDYDLKQGLLSQNVLYNHFNDFSSVLPVEDLPYYKMILVDSYQNKKLTGDSSYYYDYVLNKQNKNTTGDNTRGNNMAYIKATEVGKALASQDREAAFSNNFFMVTAISSMLLTVAGIVLYILANFG